MRKTFLLTGLLLAALSLDSSAAMASEQIELIIQNQLYLSSEQQAGPQLLEDRVYVPLRLIGETLGYDVAWVETTRSVQIVTGCVASDWTLEDSAAVPEDAPIRIYIDGAELATSQETGKPFLTETGQTMIPLRLVGEALKCEVEWMDGVVIVNALPKAPIETPIELVDSEENSNSRYEITIRGNSIATAAQLNAMLKEKEPAIRKMMETQYPSLGFTPFPEKIVELYLEIGERYQIRGDIALAQALKETGYFQFYGTVQAFQNNFCGLGASGIENTGEEALNGVSPDRAFYLAGLHGLSFATVADGVEAHIQHLYAYTTEDALPEGCELVDPRFSYVNRGVAEKWTDLNGRWAIPGNGYGESILDDYWLDALE